MDKLTEVQVCLDFIGDRMIDTLGWIQYEATPNSFGYDASFQAAGPPKVTPEGIQTRAKEIVNLHKHIQELIESMPGIDRTREEQLEILTKLEEENASLAAQILAKVEEAQTFKSEINSCLQELARDKISSLQ